jgi:hypothetical protein
VFCKLQSILPWGVFCRLLLIVGVHFVRINLLRIAKLDLISQIKVFLVCNCVHFTLIGTVS